MNVMRGLAVITTSLSDSSNRQGTQSRQCNPQHTPPVSATATALAASLVPRAAVTVVLTVERPTFKEHEKREAKSKKRESRERWTWTQ